MENMKLHALDLWLTFLAVTRRAMHDTDKIEYGEIDEYIASKFQHEMEHWGNANDREMFDATQAMHQMVSLTMSGLGLEEKND